MVDLLGTGLSGVITLVAAFGGVYLGGANQRRGDERAAAREDAQHRREVAARLEDERHRDQLDLLRTVQEETVETARASIHLLFTATDLRNAGGDESALPAHLRPEQYAARAKLALHTSRVLDDAIRTLLHAFVKETTEAAMQASVITLSGTVEEAGSADSNRAQLIDKQQEEIIEALGAAIRAEIAGPAEIPAAASRAVPE